MRRVAPLLGLLGLVTFGVGFVSLLVLGLPRDDAFVWLNIFTGVGMLVAYVSFGFDSFRSLLGQRSTRYGAGAAVYSLLFVALVAGGNYLGHRHHHQWDVTEAGIHTLAPQSAKVVESLQDDLSMTAFVEGGLSPGLETLLDSYGYVGKSRVKTRIVDPDKEPALVEQANIKTAPSVYLQYGKESYVVTQPTEEAITNGIIRVTRSTKKVVYFVEGFGEAGTTAQDDPKSYTEAKDALTGENYEVKTLLLPSVESIPDDASVVVMPGVGEPLTETAIKALDAYLRRGGHLLALVGPRQGDDKLTAFFADWGARLGNDIVLDQEVRLFEGPRVGVQPLARDYGVHPITQGFRDYTIYPQTRTVTADAGGKKGVQATDLVKTSGSSWGETNVDDVFTKGVARLDDADKKGPVSVAVAVTASLKDMGITPPAPAEGQKAASEARLVVVGTPRFADNGTWMQYRLNGDLFLNAVGWLVGQEELVSIRSRSVRASRADLSSSQGTQLFYLSVLVMPELLVVLGIVVWWRRRAG